VITKNFFSSLIKLISIFKLKIKKKISPTFVGVFKTYQEAFLASNNPIKYVNKNHQVKKGFLDLETTEVSARCAIFPLFCAIVLNNEDNEKEYEFLEIGGGDNPAFLYILKSTNKKIKCQILEEENFEIEIPNEYKNYTFYKNKIEDINFKNLSSAVFSCSIQYMENYIDILNKIFENKIKYVFIVETFFTNKNENIYTLQKNVKNTTFPNTFFSLNKLNEIFEKNSYKQIYITKRNINKYSHNKLEGKEFFFRDIIYKLI
jgi:putative methyltransferase (TIGR04325 family)|tara:strand:+ start:267 stop:1049 length:783 start_codon:yes stop_codon:yes gene_type:complete